MTNSSLPRTPLPQTLRVGIGISQSPKLLILDEPSMGLAPIFVEKIFEIVSEINEQGRTIPARRAERAEALLDAAQRGCVLGTGRVPPVRRREDLRENEQYARGTSGRTSFGGVGFPGDVLQMARGSS